MACDVSFDNVVRILAALIISNVASEPLFILLCDGLCALKGVQLLSLLLYQLHNEQFCVLYS